VKQFFLKIWLKLWPWLKNKYVLTIAVFAIWMLFFDQNNMVDRIKMSSEIRQLEEDREYYREQIRKDSTRLNELTTDQENLEKYAREQFLMKKPDEDIRLPMQWSGEENAGLSGSRPWRSPDANYPQVNVALQENDSDSLLSHYRELIQLRKAHAALRTGQTILLETGNSGVYAILRSEGDEHLLVLANLTGSAIEDYALTLNDEVFPDGAIIPKTLFGDKQGVQATISNKRFKDYKPLGELPPYQAFVFQLK